MTAFSRVAVLVAACWAASGTNTYSGEEDKPVVPGADWDRVGKPESIGYSSAKLEALRGWLKTQQTNSMVISVGGRILFEYGDSTYPIVTVLDGVSRGSTGGTRSTTQNSGSGAREWVSAISTDMYNAYLQTYTEHRRVAEERLARIYRQLSLRMNDVRVTAENTFHPCW
jgi:hypothetical protein